MVELLLSMKGSLSCCKLCKLALAAENIELKNSEREMHSFHALRLHKKTVGRKSILGKQNSLYSQEQHESLEFLPWFSGTAKHSSLMPWCVFSGWNQRVSKQKMYLLSTQLLGRHLSAFCIADGLLTSINIQKSLLGFF